MFFPLQPPFSPQGDSVNVVGWISHTSLIGWLSCAYNITGFQFRQCIILCRSKTTSKWHFHRVAVTVTLQSLPVFVPVLDYLLLYFWPDVLLSVHYF